VRKSTLRKWLDAEGFDWSSGRIIYHKTSEEDCPGWTSDIESREEINSEHPIFDFEFSSGFGGPKCPRIFARDKDAIYFPSQYDGSTCLERVAIDCGFYLQDRSQTPYPGG
jgi:hypothetical protein